MSSRSHRRFIPGLTVFILLEAASLYIMTSREGRQQQWIGSAFTSIQACLWKPVESWKTFIGLKAENEKLSEENLELVKKVVGLIQSRNDSPQWQSIRENFSIMSACIVSMTSGSQHNYLIIDRGKSDGVEEGDGIITTRGIIGIVQGTSAHYASAVSYENANMVISARLGHDGPVGAMSWTGLDSHTSILTGIPLHTAVEPGDSVFTSGFSSIFPADLPLGIVLSTKTNSGSVCDVTVDLLEDFSSLRHVMVIKNHNKQEMESLQ